MKEAKKYAELETEERTEEEVGTSTLSVRQRNPMTPVERQKFLHRRNEEFSTKQRKPVTISTQEGKSKMNIGNDHIEYLKQPKILIDGMRHPLLPTIKYADSPPFSNNDEHNKGIDQTISMMKNGDGDIWTVKKPEVMINGIQSSNILEEINQPRHDPDRARENSLSAGQKEEINAHNKRAKQNNLTDEKRKEINARRRSRYRAQRNILPDEQKEGTTLLTINLASSTQRKTTGERTSSPPAPPSTSTPEYTIRTDGEMEEFINGIMEENAIPDDNQDNRCYTYEREGFDEDDMDTNTTTYSSGPEYIDPFDFVYSNLSDNTHILQQVPNCEFCNAKKFERETDGFCC